MAKIDKEQVTWEASEFVEYHKGAGWYVWLSFVALAIAGVFIWQQQYLSAGVVILAFIVLFTQSKLKPKNNKYSLSDEGLSINDKFYPFTEMKIFWLVLGPDGNTIYVRTTHRFRAPLSIFLGNINPQPIQEFLQKHIPEDDKLGESTADRITRLFKF